MLRGRTLGLGLIAGGVLLGLLVIAWLIVNAMSGILKGGGFICGLVLLAVFVLPLLGVGIYTLLHTREEAQEAQTFDRRRRALEGDNLFRKNLAQQVQQLVDRMAAVQADLTRAGEQGAAALLARSATKVRALGNELPTASYDEAAWLDVVGPETRDWSAVESYNNVLSQQARRIGEQLDSLSAAEPAQRPQLATQVGQTVDSMIESFRQRQDLLVRGQKAASATPLAVLSEHGRQDTAALRNLKLDDAVTFEGTDYLVQGKVTYFAGGRYWYSYLLREKESERWLRTMPQGGDPFMCEMLPAPPPLAADNTVALDGQHLTRSDVGSADVTVEGAAGTERGVFVQYQLFAGNRKALWLEDWPDGPRAYSGHQVYQEELELWLRSQPTETEKE